MSALVNPLTRQNKFTELFPRDCRAFKKFMVNSPECFSDEDMSKLSVEVRCQKCMKELMDFVCGTSPSFFTGRMNCDGGCDLAGFWRLFGSETPLLAKVDIWVSFLSATCAVERSFSAQKEIHNQTRNRLLSERVKKLMFIRWNLRLFAGLGPEVADAVDELSSLIDEALTDAVEEGEDAVRTQLW